MAVFKLTDSQQVPLTLAFTDKKGNPVAQPQGTITWAVDNTALLALTPSADTLSCVIVPVGPLGTAVVSVKLADASGATVAAGTISIEIDAGNATNIVVTPGTPTDQP